MGFADLVAGMDRAVQDNLGSVTILYAPTVGAPVQLQAMFDNDQPGVAGSGTGVEQQFYRASLRLEDLPGIDPVNEKRATVTVPYPGGSLYRVHESHPDNEGLIVLSLHKVRS